MIASRARQIVLTGVSRGLGLALAQQFVELGHTVHGCARSKDAVAALKKRWPAPHRFSTIDVVEDAAVRRWARATLAAAGHVDLLINNAAVINRNARLWEVPAREFSNVVDVNIKGVTNVLRHFLPAIVAKRSGVIVNFSSGWGRSTAPEVAPYCATKWAVEGLTEALSKELPRGVAAVALNPGIVDTDMLRSCFGDAASHYLGAEAWAQGAAAFILGISASDNGKPLTVPNA